MLTVRHATIAAGASESTPINLQPAPGALSGGMPVALIIPAALDLSGVAGDAILFTASGDGITFLPVCPSARVQDVADMTTGFYTARIPTGVDDAALACRIPLDPAVFRGAVFVKIGVVTSDGEPVLQTADRQFRVTLSDKY